MLASVRRERERRGKRMEHGIIFWIVVGLIAGALAKMVVPGREPGGMLWSIIIGIMGALVGGFMFNATMGHSMHGFWGSTFVAFIGALILLFIYHAAAGRRRAL